MVVGKRPEGLDKEKIYNTDDLKKGFESKNPKLKFDDFRGNFRNILTIYGILKTEDKNYYSKYGTYLFSWGDDFQTKGEKRLREFLKKNFCVNWIKRAKIENIDDGNTIKFSIGKNYLSLRLNKKQNKINLKIDGVKTAEFGLIVKREKGKLNIYDGRFPYVVDNEINIINTGRLAEFYCMWLFGVKISVKSNNNGFDGYLGDKRIEIKQRANKGDASTEFLLQDKNGKKRFDWFFYVHLDKDTLTPTRINCYKYEDMESWAKDKYTEKDARALRKPRRIIFSQIDSSPIFQSVKE